MTAPSGGVVLATRLMAQGYFIFSANLEFTDNLANVIFREVMKPPLWLLGFIYFLFLSLVVAIWAAFDNQSALIALIIATVVIILIAIKWRSTISFDGNWLYVNGAHIELRYIKEVIAANKEQMRALRTREADPAAYLSLTFWIPTGIKVILRDERDPTPYWLVSVRSYEELTRTLCKSL